jgi:hypothetical protein
MALSDNALARAKTSFQLDRPMFSLDITLKWQ